MPSCTLVSFALSKLTLSFSNSFHVPCIIIPDVYFFILQSKAGVLNQMAHLCFRRRSTIDQLNIQTATADIIYLD